MSQTWNTAGPRMESETDTAQRSAEPASDENAEGDDDGAREVDERTLAELVAEAQSERGRFGERTVAAALLEDDDE